MQKIWKFCNLQFLVYKVFVKPETSIEGTLIGHVGLQTISTASLKFGDTLLGEKKNFRTRNGFLLTDFVLQNKPKFWVVRTGPFPWNNRNYHVLSSLWNSIDVYLNLLEKETTQLSISWSSMFLVLSLSMPFVQNCYRIVNLVPEKSKIMMLN